ncbi:MAG: hypothetical protein EZS28_013709 [Streblomastix strix]|uniref:Uncharacterized protein n=1 Tax=Streblomastix strix TaxID=222440 RepID=A0A5J4W7T2_9EUKA|nr:MAG: hypothetical protein EZS28_013709 [Streblomastix strix]
MPICPAILSHPSIEYLMAYGLMDQFKAQRGFIIYDFETLSDQVMKEITDQTTLLSQLSKLSIASTEVYPNRDKSDKQTYYSDFDIIADYLKPNPKVKPFKLTAGQWKNKCYNYKQQGYKAGRETEKNVTADDYDYYKRLFETSICSI